ncbi:MAG: hypothetical protein AMXMBFR47_16500 [Planctomycetota bacterium]
MTRRTPESRATSTREGLFQSSYPEASPSSILFGVIFGAIMNAAITYSGLKIGFTITGSSIAAVLGFGVLRGLLRRGTILEVNIGQTIASAVNTVNSGVIFTVPVLLLLDLNFDLRFDDTGFWLITLACIAGGLLGVAFIVPLRKQMLDIDRLRFPSPTAVAAILKSPGAGTAKSIVLAVGVLLGALIYLPAGLPAIDSPATLDQLDSLVARERCTPAQAALTREIASWIDARTAPPAVVERGRLLHERNRLLRESVAGSGAESRGEVPVLEGQIGENQLNRLSEKIAAAAVDNRFNDPLCIAAYEATEGRIEWSALRAKVNGWAMSRLWGYQDLGWRLGGGGGADRNGDSRPDLVMQDDRIDAGRLLGLPDTMQLVFAIAPFALGAGYLTGRAGLMVLAGGVLAYLLLNPFAYWQGWMPQTVRPHEVAGYALGAFNRPLGIGLLLGGALMGVLAALPAIREAVKSIMLAGKQKAGLVAARDEMSFSSLVVLVLVGAGLLLLAAEFVGDPTGTATGGWLSGLNPWLAKAVIVLVACAWIWFAGIIIAQCSGMTDWSPISGMALLTVVLVMMLAGPSDVISAVLIGAALCVAITCASDMMGDLKTGYLVGAQPRRQQILEVATCILGPIVTMSTLVLIVGANTAQTGIPIGPGTPTEAPQAQALKAVITGVQGGEMPYALYGLGALLGVFLGFGAFPGLGVLVGLSMYLPFMYILTYGVGCVANIVVGRIKGRAWAEAWGVPLCAGLIVGEAILALLINSIVLLRG